MGPPRRPARDETMQMRFSRTVDLKFDLEGSSEALIKKAALDEYQRNAAFIAQLLANQSDSESEDAEEDTAVELKEDDAIMEEETQPFEGLNEVLEIVK